MLNKMACFSVFLLILLLLGCTQSPAAQNGQQPGTKTEPPKAITFEEGILQLEKIYADQGIEFPTLKKSSEKLTGSEIDAIIAKNVAEKEKIETIMKNMALFKNKLAKQTEDEKALAAFADVLVEVHNMDFALFSDVSIAKMLQEGVTADEEFCANVSVKADSYIALVLNASKEMDSKLKFFVQNFPAQAQKIGVTQSKAEDLMRIDNAMYLFGISRPFERMCGFAANLNAKLLKYQEFGSEISDCSKKENFVQASEEFLEVINEGITLSGELAAGYQKYDVTGKEVETIEQSIAQLEVLKKQVSDGIESVNSSCK